MLSEVIANILIVDDEAGTGYALKLLLELDGYEVIVAADGHEAFMLASADPPDFVITDIYMPKASGFDLIRRIKTCPALAHIPIIVISSAEPDELRQARELGARAALPKPIEYSRLLACLRGNPSGWLVECLNGTKYAFPIQLNQHYNPESAPHNSQSFSNPFTRR
jgi:Response regulator containing CheY-like receiver, AAA-type ATPase, and DNA-binding domains